MAASISIQPDVATAHGEDGHFHCASAFARTVEHCPSCGVHGVLMVLGFAVIMAFGVFVSRYLRFRPWFFGLHLTAQAGALLLIIPAVVLAIVEMEGVLPKRLGGPDRILVKCHNILGYFTVGLVLVQVLIGALAHFTFHPERRRTPFIPDRIHWLLGWTILGSAVTTTLIGIKIMQVSWYYMLVFGVYVCIILAIILFMEIVTSRDLEHPHLKERYEHRGDRREDDRIFPEEVDTETQTQPSVS